MQKQSNTPTKGRGSKVVKMKKPTYEELEAKLAVLETEVKAIPEDLDQKIEYFSRKQELIKKRDHFDAIELLLVRHLKNLNEQKELADTDQFETQTFSLQLFSHGNYGHNNDPVFKVTTFEVIESFIDSLINGVSEKKMAIEKEIQA